MRLDLVGTLRADVAPTLGGVREVAVGPRRIGLARDARVPRRELEVVLLPLLDPLLRDVDVVADQAESSRIRTGCRQSPPARW